MTTVKTFNDTQIKELIKAAPKELRQYLEAKDRVINMQQETINKAIQKIKELS